MTNNSVFNNEKQPLYMLINNAYSSPASVAPPDANAAVAGQLFSVTTGNAAVGGGNNQLLQITNPVGSTKSLYISKISGGTTAAATLTIYSGGTVTGGTTPTPFNLHFGSTIVSLAAARVATGQVTGTSTTVMSMPLAAGMFALDFTGGIIVPPSRILTLSLGPGSITAATNIIWWEA